ncbi:MAG: hypothetical protein C5B49_07110 [Bdellovibrio sp.]|nr:MAG: hypothetical protein C5B49_07110 [Bdellovibrio sp.]
MRKILPFPKERSQRARALIKSEAQRLFLSMSLLSLILVAVYSTDHMMKSQRPVYLIATQESGSLSGPGSEEKLNRTVANFQPTEVFRDLDWERRLAERLGQNDSERAPASISQRVTLMDELKYGPLAGKYLIRASANDAKEVKMDVAEIKYVESDEVSDQPIRISDAKAFLMKYRSLMKVPFANVELSYKSDGQEVWQLLDSHQAPMGRAKLTFDDQGRFVRMSLE